MELFLAARLALDLLTDRPEEEAPEVERTALPLRDTLWAALRLVVAEREADVLLEEVAALRVAEVLRVVAVLRVEATPARVVPAPREETAVRETEDTRATLPLRKELLRTPDPKADAEALRRRSLWRPLCSGPI